MNRGFGVVRDRDEKFVSGRGEYVCEGTGTPSMLI
jgi:hypothetical protein